MIGGSVQSPPRPGPSGINGTGHNAQGTRAPGDNQAPQPYEIHLTGTRVFAKNNAVNKTYRVKFNDQLQGRKLIDLHSELSSMFDDLLGHAKRGIDANDLAVVIVDHDGLNDSIVVPLQQADQVTADTVTNHVQDVLQSNTDLVMDQSFEVTVGAINVPKGNGKKYLGANISKNNKRSIVEICNCDNLCLSRAIAVSWSHSIVVSNDEWSALDPKPGVINNIKLILQHRKMPRAYYKLICDKRWQVQRTLALVLCDLANVASDMPGTLNDIGAFERALNVRICVLCESLGNRIIRAPPNDNLQHPLLFLRLEDHDRTSHFDSVVSITGIFNKSYFCQSCLVAYDHTTEHCCPVTCLVCKTAPCVEDDSIVSCKSCHMKCRSSACFNRHKLPGKHDKVSQCDKYWRCTNCTKVVSKCHRDMEKVPHQCGEWQCKCCQCWVIGDHVCYARAEKPKSTDANFVFFDFEARQDGVAECKYGYTPNPSCDNCTVDNRCDKCMVCTSCKESYCGKQRHTVNFVVAHTVCQQCLDESMSPRAKCFSCGTRCPACNKRNKGGSYAAQPCDTCGVREVVFSGDDTSEKFGKWLFSDQHRDSTVLAHNMKGYDGVFLLEYLLNHGLRPQKIIYNGTKIMYMHVQRGLNMRIIDSLNFLPMSLRSLPETLDLTELKKGYFPHFFNTGENQQYVGPIPDVKYYGADQMKPEDRASFLLWHEEQTSQNVEFDFRKEMLEYCISDVDILRQACLKFRQLILEVTGGLVCPFKSVTIASACMTIFKTLFLPENHMVKLRDPSGLITKWIPATVKNGQWRVQLNGTWSELNALENYAVVAKKFIDSPIAQVPNAGYISRDNFSKSSIQWLEYLMERSRQTRNPIQIQHAMNQAEYKIPGTRYKVDGYCASTNTVFEYHGCIWHGCPTCFPTDRKTTKSPRTNQSMDELYALTMDKKRTIIQMGYRYKCIWEHTFMAQIQNDSALNNFVQTLDVQHRLDPRDSFFGGRTNATKLRCEAKEGEQIKYVDFCSLYPYINASSAYPVGHPEIITSNFRPITEYFGIAKVTVLPPRQLYHPVLPYRSGGKLKFPLCRTCADEELITSCTHNDAQRSLTGTWCTPELYAALRKGYTIDTIYEVYHWDQTTQYDSVSKEGGLFVEYINTFLKLKQQASDWPKWCTSQDDKDKYLTDYMDHQGIELDPEKIETNPGLRNLAKLMLNSMWGKWGQRQNMTQHEFYHELELDKFLRTLTDPKKCISSFHIVNEQNILLEWSYQSTFVPDDMKTNIFLATFTTCFARLKLYDLLDTLGERVIYFDTDSAIFLSRPGDVDPPTGDFLGDLTDELKGSYITDFVSGGPKNYAYRTNKGKQKCKVKGFSLNFDNSQHLNFDSMTEMVTNVNHTKPVTFSGKRKATDPTGKKLAKRTKTDKKNEPEKNGVITLVNPSKICRSKDHNIIYNREERKQYRIVYTKRVIQPDLDTLPYGY